MCVEVIIIDDCPKTLFGRYQKQPRPLERFKNCSLLANIVSERLQVTFHLCSLWAMGRPSTDACGLFFPCIRKYGEHPNLRQIMPDFPFFFFSITTRPSCLEHKMTTNWVVSTEPQAIAATASSPVGRNSLPCTSLGTSVKSISWLNCGQLCSSCFPEWPAPD